MKAHLKAHMNNNLTIKEVYAYEKTVSLILALVLALFASLPVGVAESNTGAVQKYGNIGRLSKLNITEDELNEVLKDIMVNSICNR